MPVQILIEMSDRGEVRIQMQGSTPYDKAVKLGLLEIAKKSLLDPQPQPEQRVVPVAVMPQVLGG